MNIEAMKQAADQLEIGLAYPGMRFYHDKIRAALTALRTAIAEAEKQEPVAWMDASETALSWENYLDGMKPLYTSPPAQRPWVGLTDEQINQYDYQYRDLLYDAEKMLKENNT
jgi:hypothetical protein